MVDSPPYRLLSFRPGHAGVIDESTFLDARSLGQGVGRAGPVGPPRCRQATGPAVRPECLLLLHDEAPAGLSAGGPGSAPARRGPGGRADGGPGGGAADRAGGCGGAGRIAPRGVAPRSAGHLSGHAAGPGTPAGGTHPAMAPGPPGAGNPHPHANQAPALDLGTAVPGPGGAAGPDPLYAHRPAARDGQRRTPEAAPGPEEGRRAEQAARRE